MTEALRVRQLVKTYKPLFGEGQQALRGLTLSIPAGAAFGLIGPNGAGQTDEADILDLARVRAAGGAGGFRLEAGLPYEYMAKTFRTCIEARKKRR